MSTKERVTLLFLSGWAFINAVFCPIYNHNYEGGLFPESYYNFGDVCEIIQEYLEWEVDAEYWVLTPIIPLSVVCFVSALLMLIGAVSGSRNLFADGCGIGAVFLCILTIIYFFLHAVEYENPFQAMFGLENGSVAYGFWVAIVLSIISCFYMRDSSKKQVSGTQKTNVSNVAYESSDSSTRIYNDTKNDRRLL